MAASTEPTEEPDQGPWIHVKSKPRYRKNTRKVPVKTPIPPLSSQPQEPRSHKSASDIAAEYDKFRLRWRDTPCHDRLREIVSSNSSQNKPVQTAICLGLGTFDPEDGGWDAKRRTYIQLDAFLTIVECLSRHSKEPISCIFQEPRFSSSDKEFLQALGHKVVDSPSAFGLVDDATLLFAIHMYRPIYEAALEEALPAMFVGTSLDVWDEFGNLKTGDFHRMREMDDSHQKLEFPQDGTYTTFSSTSIYWKRLPDPETAQAPSKCPEISARDTQPG